MSADEGANDFDAAKRISDLLKGMEKDRQRRILRWVAESLDVQLTAPFPSEQRPAPGVLRDAGEGLGSSAPTPGRAVDIKSFVDSKSPKSDQQFAAVVAYYYRFEAGIDERRESITADVLQDAARLAGRSRLTRPLMTLNNAKKQGYLDAVERGQFRINSVGENLVAMTLPGANAAETSARPRRGRAKPKNRAGKRTRATRSSRGKPKKRSATKRSKPKRR